MPGSPNGDLPASVGGVSDSSCPDVLWQIQTEFARAVIGDAPPRYILSMDLAKCFDRLHLDTLHAITDKLQLPVCTHALSNYARLTRLLCVDNEPSDVWLSGENLVGIPQACTLACFFCNLTAVAWHHACSQVVPTAQRYTYLDDRFVISASWDDLQAVLTATDNLDAALGLVLNFRKCVKGIVAPPRHRKPVCPAGSLAQIQLASSFRYLGVDILIGSRAKAHVAKRKIAALGNRCEILRNLPRQQRGMAVADAIASMWPDGAHAYTRQHMATAVSAAALGLMGRAQHEQRAAGRVQ